MLDKRGRRVVTGGGEGEGIKNNNNIGDNIALSNRSSLFKIALIWTLVENMKLFWQGSKKWILIQDIEHFIFHKLLLDMSCEEQWPVSRLGRYILMLSTFQGWVHSTTAKNTFKSWLNVKIARCVHSCPEQWLATMIVTCSGRQLKGRVNFV